MTSNYCSIFAKFWPLGALEMSYSAGGRSRSGHRLNSASFGLKIYFRQLSEVTGDSILIAFKKSYFSHIPMLIRYGSFNVSPRLTK